MKPTLIPPSALRPARAATHRLTLARALLGSFLIAGTAWAAQQQGGGAGGAGRVVGGGGGGGGRGSGGGIGGIAADHGNAGAGGHSGGGALTVGVSPEAQTFQRVRDPAIAADLALLPVQRKAFDQAQRQCDQATEQLEQTMHRLEQAGPQSPNFGREMSAAFARAEREIFAAMRPALATLTPAQHKRLQEIRYQHPLLLVNPSAEVIAALELTPDQIEKARRINEEARRDAFGALHSARGPVETRRQESRSADGSTFSASSFSSATGSPDPAVQATALKGMRDATEREDRRLREEVLTPAQQKKLRQLQGRPLKPLVHGAP